DSANTPMRGTREGAGAPDRGDEWFVVHRAMAAGTPALAYVVRLRAPSAFAEVAAIARAAFPGSVVRVETMAARYAESYGDMRMAAGAATGFGVVAGVVTLAGLYAVVAHLVATRTREIGIRMALGAGRRDIRRLVFAPAARGIAAGLVAGSGMAVAGARLIESRLHGVSWTAPSLYAVVAAGIAVTAFLATRPPVRQALRIDPADTLRSE
ncbi:MAG TPA: FtsX-like permease family protein, partial [Vicinamibacterales bacterium]|nr:FtsX-like permease family protein [Vicinamibacterales bacterium]